MIGLISRAVAKDGHLPYWRYRVILGQVPISCVDLLPVRTFDGRLQVLLIRRRDEYDRLAWAMIGGGVYRNETLSAALKRHLTDTLGKNVALETPDLSRPSYVAQYFPKPSAEFGVDPRKHAVALTYWAQLEGFPVAIGEAEDFDWFDLSSLPPPEAFGYGHDRAVLQLCDEILHGDKGGSASAEKARGTARG